MLTGRACLGQWPLFSGANLTSPRTEILFTPLKVTRAEDGPSLLIHPPSPLLSLSLFSSLFSSLASLRSSASLLPPSYLPRPYLPPLLLLSALVGFPQSVTARAGTSCAKITCNARHTLRAASVRRRPVSADSASACPCATCSHEPPLAIYPGRRRAFSRRRLSRCSVTKMGRSRPGWLSAARVAVGETASFC